jgi:hypothetical protein
MADYNQYDIFTPDDREVPFSHFGKLLPILMFSIIPALLLLYITTRLGYHILIAAAGALTIFLIVASSIVIIISGILGYMEARKYRRLAHPNTHPRPRRSI